ncbi:hypothetical protein E4T50_16791 [Aureobasidium sp. EXF-12298]|nr:hypothetical protein E4T50_16791 [Aureobasidium sp. EXF-12298]
MLIARKPIALLILGYYSVLMKLRSDTMWPFDTWPAKLLNRIEEVLGDDWDEYLEWPRTSARVSAVDVVTGFADQTAAETTFYLCNAS